MSLFFKLKKQIKIFDDKFKIFDCLAKFWRPDNRKVPEKEVLHIYLYQDDLGKLVQPSPCSPFFPR